MRTKGKIKKRSPVPQWVYAASGYAVLFLLVVFHLSVYVMKIHEISPMFPKYTTGPWQELAMLAGGPAVLLLSLGLSFYSRKLSGALLLLGAALVSAGIAFQSGYFLKTYLVRMALIGVPQIIAGAMFIKAAKPAVKR